MCKLRNSIILLIWMLGWIPFSGTGITYVPEQVEEYELKAAFLYNFTQFIEWNSLEHADSFYIGIVGNSPIRVYLDEIARKQKVQQKPIKVKTVQSIQELDQYHMVFISKQAGWNLEQILGQIENKPILLVGEQDGLAEQGVDLNFIIRDNRLRFEANLSRLEESGLKVSSQLLKLAIIIDEH